MKKLVVLTMAICMLSTMAMAQDPDPNSMGVYLKGADGSITWDNGFCPAAPMMVDAYIVFANVGMPVDSFEFRLEVLNAMFWQMVWPTSTGAPFNASVHPQYVASWYPNAVQPTAEGHIIIATINAYANPGFSVAAATPDIPSPLFPGYCGALSGETMIQIFSSVSPDGTFDLNQPLFGCPAPVNAQEKTWSEVKGLFN